MDQLTHPIANALVHQDFLATGTSVMIEMYSDRIEISNPGIPPIKVERFIDENRSRNEQLANLMRLFHICEQKGSGIDKVVSAAEMFQLPAPDFRVSHTRTTAVLFADQDFADMSKADRIQACYQHCCLLYVSYQRVSNQTLDFAQSVDTPSFCWGKPNGVCLKAYTGNDRSFTSQKLSIPTNFSKHKAVHF